MTSVSIYPGSMEVISQALDKFGEARVVTGAWDKPVLINDLTEVEIAFALQFFGELGCMVFEEQDLSR